MEPMFPKQTQVGVHLVISTTVGALKGIQTWFIFFCLKMREVSFIICFATPPELMIVFSLMRAIALDILRALDMVGYSCMFPSPEIFVLRDTMLQTQELSVCSRERTLYWVNTRELDRELCTR